MSNRAPAWVVPVMRCGYAARGLVYVLVGGLAVAAAFQGGNAEGTGGAMSRVSDEAWGVALLWVIAIGLFAYAIWRIIDAWMDLDEHGTDAKGIVARTGLVVTGLVHLGLGVAAARAAMGDSSGGEDGKAETWTAQLMAQPFGVWLVGLAGAATIGAGIYYFWKGYSEKYKSHLRRTETTEKLNPVMRFGLYAHGFAVGLIGGFLVYAAMTHDPSKAGGLNQAFAVVQSAAFGRILLGLLALGLVAFAVYCFIEAIYRIVPRRAGDDVRTLAGKVRSTLRNA